MTLEQLQTLKTPVILREKDTIHRTNYLRVTKVVFGNELSSYTEWGGDMYCDLLVGGEDHNKLKYIHFYSKPELISHLLFEPSPEDFTKVPWKQAKREILELLLGREQ